MKKAKRIKKNRDIRPESEEKLPCALLLITTS
jgi:hypothetical protein